MRWAMAHSETTRNRGESQRRRRRRRRLRVFYRVERLLLCNCILRCQDLFVGAMCNGGWWGPSSKRKGRELARWRQNSFQKKILIFFSASMWVVRAHNLELLLPQYNRSGDTPQHIDKIVNEQLYYTTCTTQAGERAHWNKFICSKHERLLKRIYICAACAFNCIINCLFHSVIG